MKKQIIGIMWSIYGNQNHILREDMVDRFRKDGYRIYNATYRPGFYTRKKEYESDPGVELMYKPLKKG